MFSKCLLWGNNRNSREFPGISENFQEFPRIPKNFREFPRIPPNFRKFPEIFRWFSLRNLLQNHPQNLIFGACGAKKFGKSRFYRHGKMTKIPRFNYGTRYPQNFSASVCATGLPLNQNSGRSQLVSSLKSQLSTLNLSTLFSSSPIWESTAEVSRGRGVPRPNSKSRKLGFFRFLYAPVAPINFSVSVSKSERKCTDGVVW